MLFRPDFFRSEILAIPAAFDLAAAFADPAVTVPTALLLLPAYALAFTIDFLFAPAFDFILGLLTGPPDAPLGGENSIKTAPLRSLVF